MKLEPSTSRRGLFVIAILAVTVALAGGAVLAALRRDGGRLPAPSAPERLAHAYAAYADHQHHRAEELLASLLQEGVLGTSERLFYGRVLLELGRLSKARDIFNAIHKEEPKSAEAVLSLGEVHERSGEQDLAITCYKRAADMKKDDARAFKLLGLAQYRGGDRMAAMFSIRQSLKLQPGQEDLSRLLNDIGNARQARAGIPDSRSRSAAFDPFEDYAPRGQDPRAFMPGPEIPDPMRGLPRPDGRIR
jgi:tetratricopeptide (TPR) repeat protein